MTKKEKNKWAILGAIAGVCAAPFTGGTSLIMVGASTGIGLVGGNIIGELIEGDSGNDDNSGFLQAQQNYQAQMEQWKVLNEERRKDLERLRKKEEEKEKQIKRNEEEINSLKSKLNDPNLSEDEKNKIRKRLIVIEDDNKRLKGELTTIRTQIKTAEDDKPPAPTTPSTPWKFPKLSVYDKLLASAILVLIIYFLFLREDKKR